MARATSTKPRALSKPPPLVADAVAKQSEASLMTRIMDALKAIDQRMTALEQRADEQERERRPKKALTLAEDIAEKRRKRCCRRWPTDTARLH